METSDKVPFNEVKTLVHNADMRASEMMLEVQKAKDFPLKVKVGRSTYTLESMYDARKFALGMLAVLEAHEIEDAADSV
jgi:hypothetical protein